MNFRQTRNGTDGTGMAKRPDFRTAVLPMQIAADDENDLTAADAGNYRSPMAGAFNA